MRDSDKLPKALVPDEKHTASNGQKTYIATTAGGECVLGAAMRPSAGAKDLLQAYGQFKTEALNVDPDYQPDSATTDGWPATINPWLARFPSVTMILCFRHAFIKIRSCGKRLGDTYFELCTKVGAVYHCASADEFHPQMADLAIWALEHLPDGPTLNAVIKLCLKYESFAKAYAHPTAHRTSNMVDRHMGAMDRYLVAGHFFHWMVFSSYRMNNSPPKRTTKWQYLQRRHIVNHRVPLCIFSPTRVLNNLAWHGWNQRDGFVKESE